MVHLQPFAVCSATSTSTDAGSMCPPGLSVVGSFFGGSLKPCAGTVRRSRFDFPVCNSCMDDFRATAPLTVMSWPLSTTMRRVSCFVIVKPRIACSSELVANRSSSISSRHQPAFFTVSEVMRREPPSATSITSAPSAQIRPPSRGVSQELQARVAGGKKAASELLTKFKVIDLDVRPDDHE